MQRAWDPEIATYFKKIINTVSLILCWLLAVMTAGIYFRLAYNRPLLYMIIYWAIVLVTLFLLIRYLYKTWKKPAKMTES